MIRPPKNKIIPMQLSFRSALLLLPNSIHAKIIGMLMLVVAGGRILKRRVQVITLSAMMIPLEVACMRDINVHIGLRLRLL